jgi:L-lactate dehydrogenase complex protein LldF
VFRQVSGYAYDPVYSGPIGAVITPLLKGTREAGELAHASTLCAACSEVCPVKIPLHDLLLYLRQDYAQDHASGAERTAYRAWSLSWATPLRFKFLTALSILLGRITSGRSLRRIYLPVLSRWTRGRTFPGFPAPDDRSRRNDHG